MTPYAAALLALAVVMGGDLLPAQAMNSVNLNVDLTSSYGTTKTQKADGESSKADFFNFDQRYHFSLARDFYPLVRLRAGTLYERDQYTSTTDDMKTTGTSSQLDPYVDLRVGSQFLNAGLGFNRQQYISASGTETRDAYTSSLNWLPYELPSLNLRFTHSHNFNSAGTTDETQDWLQITSRYRPVQPVELSYAGQQFTSTDITGTKTTSTAHSGRIGYNDYFFHHRLQISSAYAVNYRNSEVDFGNSGGTGSAEIGIPISSLQFLTGSDNTLDGDTDIGTGSSVLSVQFIAQAPQVLPQSALGVNGLRLFVKATSQPPGGGQATDTTHYLDNSAITQLFHFEVSTTTDDLDAVKNGTAQWTTVDSQLATFQSDFNGNYYEIRFPLLKVPPTGTRFFRVVAKPLQEGSLDPSIQGNLPDIEVTNLQPVFFETFTNAQGQKVTSWSLAHQANLAGRYHLLENPNLNYNFAFFYATAQPSGTSQLFISNGLTLQRRFLSWLNGTAEVERDDSIESGTEGNSVIYRYGTSLTAIPLPALSHTLSLSGQRQYQNIGETTHHAISLYNHVALYRGVDLLFGGTMSFSTLPGGRQGQTYQTTFGMTLRPHPALELGLSGMDSRSKQHGGKQPAHSDHQQNLRISISFNPLPTLSLYTARQEITVSGKHYTLQNYSVGWSPLLSGALQFNFGYSEQLQSESNGVNKNWGPSLRWQIRPRVYLTAAYNNSDDKSDSGETKSQSGTIGLQATF